MSRLARPIALVLCAAALAAAQSAPPRGSYAVAGRDAQGQPWRGWARVALDAAGRPRVTLEGGPAGWEGLLEPAAGGWTCRASRGGQGLTGALEGAAADRTELEASYRPLGGERWQGSLREREPSGAWRPAGTQVWTPAPRSAVRIAVSVDWEGRDLAEENLRAIERFRERLPQVPLTQFLNAAYYTKPALAPPGLAATLAEVSTASAAAALAGTSGYPEVTAAIARALRPGDERGLHVHAWRSLVEAAGVEFRTAPSFWGGGRPLQRCAGDEGHEVELGAYEEPEVRAIVRTSLRLLASQGLPVARSFRAGGWIAPAHVLSAIRAEGILIDSSAVPPLWHDELAGLALQGRLEQLWAGVRPSAQPERVTTLAGELIEMPDTCALADYVTAAEMIDHGRLALRRLSEQPGEVYVHFGFHQETAARFLPRLEQALATLAAEGGTRVVFETLSRSAGRVRREHALALERTRRLREGAARGGLPLPSLPAPR